MQRSVYNSDAVSTADSQQMNNTNSKNGISPDVNSLFGNIRTVGIVVGHIGFVLRNASMETKQMQSHSYTFCNDEAFLCLLKITLQIPSKKDVYLCVSLSMYFYL